MYVYSISIKIVTEIESPWIEWQKKTHIPHIMNTGCFTHNTLYKLIEPVDEDGCTYIIQFFAVTKEDYDAYIQEHADRIRKSAFEKWGNKFIAFRTLLKVAY